MVVKQLLNQIIPVYNKTIQLNGMNNILAVKDDNNTMIKVFKINKKIGDIDISNFACWILIQRADGSSYNIPIANKTIEDDYIYVTWIVSRTDCAVPGITLVSIKFGDNETDSIWQTIPAKFEVINSISEGNIDPVEPNILEATIIEVTKIKEEMEQMLKEGPQIPWTNFKEE